MEKTVLKFLSDETMLKAIFFDNVAGATICEDRPPFTIWAANPAFLNMAGHKPKDVVGRPYCDFVDKEEIKPHAIAFLASRQVRSSFGPFLKRLKGRGGYFIYVRTMVFIPKNGPIFILDLDRTEEAARAAALLAADRLMKKPLPPEVRGRRLEVAELAAAGLSSQEIADRLNLSKLTIDNYRAGLRRDLGVPKRETLSVFFSRFRF